MYVACSLKIGKSKTIYYKQLTSQFWTQKCKASLLSRNENLQEKT